LARAPIGFEVELDDPAGELVWQDAPAALLVGAGTGVTPLRALVEEAVLRDQRNVPVMLLAGARSEQEMLWAEELTALAATGRRGWVQAHLADAVLALPPGFAAYLCGSRAMVEQCREALERLGVTGSRLRHESF
jgi:ferredoxin-NADP reductase